MSQVIIFKDKSDIRNSLREISMISLACVFSFPIRNVSDSFSLNTPKLIFIQANLGPEFCLELLGNDNIHYEILKAIR